ncbi:Uncharacterised protein [uncultured archaeon]|nr:Uncharacterised protein [uncultured archaeon]
MECLLCSMWARMPYAKRYTTPTTAEQTQGAMIVGYWVARRATSAPRICEGHMAVLAMLDRQEEGRIAGEERRRRQAEEAAQAILANQPPVEVQSQINQLQERQQVVLHGPPVPPPQPTMQPIATPPMIIPEPVAPPVPAPQFKLGPGPLTNENTITAHPPLPVPENPVAPYTGIAAPGTVAGALEAATMPAVDGGKVTFPCPTCGEHISTGDVHSC